MPPRKRTRANYTEAEASDHDAEEAPPKRAKTATRQSRGKTRRAVRGKQGGLQDLPSMPLDIVFEICALLESQDLLNLTRTSKDFRSVLMQRASAFVWKAARKRVSGLPDCPPHMSEPQYANLLYSAHCHECLKDKIRDIIWEFGVRYCSECRDKKITADIEWELEDKLPPIKLDVLFNRIYRQPAKPFYHRPQVEQFVAAWEKLPTRKGRGRKTSKALSVDQSEFLEEWQARVTQIHDHATLCRHWSEDMAKARENDREDKRKSRLDGVIRKLRELGYKKELAIIAQSRYKALTSNKHVNYANVLTDQAWARMREEVVAIMEDIRQTTLARERAQADERRLATVTKMISDFDKKSFPRSPLSECVPTCVELSLIPEFRALIDGPPGRKAHFEDLNMHLGDFVKRWQDDAKSKLTQLAEEQLKLLDIATEADPLDLAVISFRCKQCSGVLEYPSMLAHSCLRRHSNGGSDDYERRVLQATRQNPWSTANLSCARLLQTARSLIEACGKDPACITKAEMDKLDERFCRGGYRRTETRYIYSWRSALQVIAESKAGELQETWTAISSPERAIVDILEANRRHKVLENFHSSGWACSLCFSGSIRNYLGDYGLKLTDMREHMQKEHSVEDPKVENGDFYLYPYVKLRHIIPEPVALIPQTVHTEALDRDEKRLLGEGRATYHTLPDVCSSSQ